MIYKLTARFLLPLFCLCTSCKKPQEAPAAGEGVELRMGHFPNLTHVQGLVAHHMSRTGQGWYERRVAELIGRPVRITWYSYNAGPSAMEAIFAHSLDLTYVGPSPVINAWVKAAGREVRIIGGSAEGGAALVVPQDSTAAVAADFRGAVLATPQLGNTQDVSCRAWLKRGGLHVTLTGGDAVVMPTRNPEQLALFAQGQFAGVWTVEPWVSRLERIGGKVLIDERTSLATVLAASEGFLRSQPEVAAAVLQAHRELTQWVNAHPDEAQQMVIAELKALTMSSLDPSLVRSAWQRIRLTAHLDVHLLQSFVKEARLAGFLKSEFDVSELVYLLPSQP